jgi:hypothetical protein
LFTGRIFSRHWKSIANDGFDNQAIRGRRQSITDTQIHVEHAELEVGNGKQSMLLVRQLGEIPDLSEICIIFEADKEVGL